MPMDEKEYRRHAQATLVKMLDAIVTLADVAVTPMVDRQKPVHDFVETIRELTVMVQKLNE